jgi:5-methylcytosine-specific restriction endonuclease McrA
MASNTGANKRIPVKWIRDGAKAAYIKQPACQICGSTEDLELHHTNSVTLMLEAWVKKTGYSIETDEDVLAIRDEFINTHYSQMYDQVYTLCNTCHVKLHGIFGKAPPLNTATKQSRWIGLQKDKFSGVAPEKKAGAFSNFY